MTSADDQQREIARLINSSEQVQKAVDTISRNVSMYAAEVVNAAADGIGRIALQRAADAISVRIDDNKHDDELPGLMYAQSIIKGMMRDPLGSRVERNDQQ